MRLTKICGENFMGGTFALELAALNIIFGEIDSGKTRIANLIKILLLGYLPSIDKKPRAIFDRLSSGRIMNVEGAFDNGEGIFRGWEEKGESVKTGKHVPRALDDTVPLVLLESDDYFERSARGRIEMAFSVVKIKGKLSDIIAALAKESGERIAGEICGRAKITDEVSIQDGIDALSVAVEELRSNAAADARRWTQTLQGLTTLQLNEKPAARSVDDIDAEIQREREAAAEKTSRRTTLKDVMSKNEEWEIERDDLEHKIEQAGDPPPKEYDIAELRQRSAALTKKRDAARRQNEDKERWGRNNVRLETDRAEWQREEELRQKEHARLSASIGRIEQQLARIPALEAEIGRLEPPPATPKNCSKCKQPLPVKGTPAHPDAERARQTIREIREAADRLLPNLRQQLSDVSEPAAQPEDIGPEPMGAADDVNVIEAELDQVNSEIDEYVATADVQTWRKRLSELPKPADNSAEIARLDGEISGHNANVTALQEERRLAESDRSDRKRLAEAQEEQVKAVAAENSFKATKAFLIQKKGELIEKVFGPLLETAARFTRNIFPQPVEYRDGELGVFVGSTWVTEATFGGARRAMLHVALQCALGVSSPCRIITVDELGNFSRKMFARFLENVRDAHAAGIFEQFVGMMPDAPEPAAVSGFTVIEATGKGYITK